MDEKLKRSKKTKTVPKWLRLPLKPDDPVIVTLNWVIDRYSQEYNQELSYVMNAPDRIRKMDDGAYPLGPFKRSYQNELTSRERSSDEGERAPYLKRDMEMIRSSVDRLIQLEQEIGDLTRLKLALFNDVDFHGGSDHIKTLNRLMDEAKQRKAENKVKERERKLREQRFRQREAFRKLFINAE